MEKLMPKIGFTSTTFRPYSKDKVIEFAKNSNVNLIEWGGDVHIKNLEDAKDIKIKCDDNNIDINSYGSYYRIGSKKIEYFKSICEIASAMNAKSIRTWLGVKGSQKTSEEEFKVIVEDAKYISKIAKDYNLIVSNECHPNTYNDTAKSAVRFLKETNMDNMKTYFQPWYVDLESETKWIDEILPYLEDVHISYKEMKRFQFFHKKNPEYINQIIEKLCSVKFKNTILLEYTKFSKPNNFYIDVVKLKESVNKIFDK